MVSPSKPNHSKVANKSSYAKCKLVKGSQPLINFKFYLDIESHSTSTRIENKIKELGGSIEFFLGKEVTHFITDKQLKSDNCATLPSPKAPSTPQTPRTSASIELAAAAISSPTHESKGTPSSIPRSRADAMLQRACLQNQDNRFSQHNNSPYKRASQSPVQIAKTYGTPIWTTEYTLKFLEKVLLDISHHQRHRHHSNHQTKKANNARVLKGNYIKIEVLHSKNYRPIYREFKSWPKLHFHLSTNDSPFESEVSSKDMTRKNNRTKTQQQIRNNNKTNTTVTTNREKKSSQDNPENQCGYCEICRDPYDVLKAHLKTSKHMNFVKNDNNFLALDNLIKNNSNVEEFLSLKSQEVVFGKRSLKRGRLLRECEIKKEKLCYDSYDEIKTDEDDDIVTTTSATKKSTIVNPPRTRRQNSKSNSIFGIAAATPKSQKSQSLSQKELDEETRRSKRESCRRINYAEPKEDDENTVDSIISQDTQSTVPIPKEKPKIRSIRWRAPSPHDRPPTQNPEIYTIKNAKSPEKKEPLSDKNKNTNERIKMKLKRVRASELALLSDEAENFMFPKREVSESETDEDRQSTSDHAEISHEIISSERDEDTKVKVGGSKEQAKSKLDSRPDTRKKRRNNLETFLNDNTDYYKFECPNSRLRFQETPTQPPLMKQELDYDELLGNKDVVGMTTVEDRVGGINFKWNTNVNVATIHKFRYAFERVPHQEPWFSAFQRQDEGKEKIFEYYGSTAYRKLPYELGPMPALQPNCCPLNGTTEKTEPVPTVSAPPSVSNVSNSIDDEDTRATSKANSIIITSPNSKRKRPKDYITKRKMYFMEQCHPRKSPREHASTLAILSSIVNDPPSSTAGTSKSRAGGSSVGDALDIDENSLESMPSRCLQQQQQDVDDETARDDVKTKPELPPLVTTEQKYLTAAECLTSNVLCHEIDKFFRFSYRNCDETVAVVNKKNIGFELGEKDFYEIISSPCVDDVTFEETFENITASEISEDIIKLKENRLLNPAEALHLARTARKRVRNRTGWPTTRRRAATVNGRKEKTEDGIEKSTNDSVLRNVDDRLKAEADMARCDVTAAAGVPILPVKNGLATRRHFKSLFSKANDMFTVSSDSMDSVPSLAKINEDNDSVSTRSLFVSDDSSLDEVISRSPAPRLSQNHIKLSNCIQTTTNGLINNRCLSRLSNKLKTNDSCSIKVEKIDDQGGGERDGDTNSINTHATRRSTKKTTTPMKKRLSQPIPITPQSPNNVSKKPSTPTSPQFSPRKLRKPRGRWYRER